MIKTGVRLPVNRTWLYTAMVALAAAGWWFFHGSSGDEKKPQPAAYVTAAQVKRRDVPIRVPLVGNVVAYETVAIKSRLDAQQITGVLFHDGDYVKEGQTLFTLDDRTIRADIKQMEAALAKEKAQLVNMKLQYERSQKLVKTNAVAQAQLDQNQAAYEAQLAQVGVAQANLDSARVQLTYATITAPISGRTGTIDVTRGNNVKANDATLVTINQITPIRVQFAIPQRYYDQVKSAMAKGDMPLEARYSPSAAAVKGKLEYIDNGIDVSNGTFAARAVFANEDEKLWPGMFVNVLLELATQKEALTIPATAVQGDESSRFVFIVDPKTKKAVRTPVDVAMNDGETAIITKGLREGEQVITDGILRVTDGAAVEVTK